VWRASHFDFLRGARHSATACRRRFRLAPLRRGDLGIDAAEIEQPPAQRRTARRLHSAAREQAQKGRLERYITNAVMIAEPIVFDKNSAIQGYGAYAILLSSL